jgi:hypothetical protein
MSAVKKIVLRLVALTVVIAAPSANLALAASTGPYPDSSLPVEGQKQLQKAVSAMKSKKWPKAHEAVNAAAASATDIGGCLFILSSLDKFGGQANHAKKAAVVKGMELAKTTDDYMKIAMRARQCEMYDVSKETLDRLVAASSSFEDLMAIGHSAHESSMADLAHLAMKKAYTLVNNEPDALEFIRQSNSIGQDVLCRKAIKDLVEDQTAASEIVNLANKFESLNMPDMIRATLKRALEKATTVSDYLAIFNAAKHFEETDIVRLAQYRGRKLTLMNKLKGEAASTPSAIADEARRTKEESVRTNLARPSGF